MALLGFKRRFAPMIRDGRKRHTIRGKRKIPIKVGEPLHCYVDPRQKTMSLLGRWPCVRVQDIRIESTDFGSTRFFFVFVDEVSFRKDECDALALSDGFESFGEMMKFWDGRLPFHGDLIHWDYDTPIARKSRKPASKRPANKKRRTDENTPTRRRKQTSTHNPN